MAEKSFENESNDPELLIDAKQLFLPQIGRELCRVRDSDVIGPRHYSDIGRAVDKFSSQSSNDNRIVHLSKQGSGEGHVIRADSLNIGGSLGCRYKSDRGEFRGYRQDILKENLSKRESTFLLCNRCKGIMREACISSNGEQFRECCRKLRPRDLYEYTSLNTHVRNTILSLKCSCVGPCPHDKPLCHILVHILVALRDTFNQHLEEKRTEHTELKLSALEEIVMQQCEMINEQGGINDKQNELISKQGKEIEEQKDLISKQKETLNEQKDLNSKHRERITTLRAVTKTTIEAWRIENLRGILFLNSPPSYKPFEVVGFKLNVGFSDTVSISMHFPPQVVSQTNKLEWPFRAIFAIRLLCHIKPSDTWEFRSKLIEVKHKDYTKKQYSCKIVEIPANNGIFLRDGGIDLQIFVILQ
ncbi:hypothetical protein LOD99_9211 [Oopsacas minuta]|uniref:MATH domain-containing protein n=1 Tax=Oopsacas minuta TaxID=111878 RepID=A0AAV7JDG9_9METZ|nr:hypothetical protein LOD99_9211 [Oopsacas minuta]